MEEESRSHICHCSRVCQAAMREEHTADAAQRLRMVSAKLQNSSTSPELLPSFLGDGVGQEGSVVCRRSDLSDTLVGAICQPGRDLITGGGGHRPLSDAPGRPNPKNCRQTRFQSRNWGKPLIRQGRHPCDGCGGGDRRLQLKRLGRCSRQRANKGAHRRKGGGRRHREVLSLD
ncbi:hypothetical protein CRENBAI_003123 [Crenichthys baileyi]|uniref:Uncharacterized protein n=1 Tax=Crenichthys baileyi TaxID=28760 RepID=A0AAV9QPK5_9TELE